MLNPEIARELHADRICTRFEEELKSRRVPRIELFLEDCTADIREGVFQELLALELWYAKERNDTLPINDYLERFPEYQDIIMSCFHENVSLPGLEQVRPLDLPAQFGRYRILKRLGHGGMGNVYLAWDQSLKRRIALKVPRISQTTDSGVLSRFRREAEAAARITHGHLCPVYDIGEVDGIVYLTMAYIEGQSLAEQLAQRHTVSVAEALSLIRKIAQALAEAHEKGVIHRDLKPSNIMLNSRGEPVVVDFGLARTDVGEQTRITATGAILGTPAYASPEQIDSHTEVDRRTDVYSLGIILYELLTGQLPFHAATPLTLLRRIIENEPLAPSAIQPDLPREIDEVCLKAIAKRAEDRFQNMQEFDEALEAVEAIRRPPDGQKSKPLPKRGSLPGLAPREDCPVSAGSTQSSKSLIGGLGPAAPSSPNITHLTRKKITLAALPIAALLGLLLWRLIPEPDPVTNPPPERAGMESQELGVAPPPATTTVPVEPDPPVPVVSIDSRDLRVQLPVPLGGWTKMTGRLWHAALSHDDALHFKLFMRCVDEQKIEGRLFQVLEFEVTTLNSNHLEQASLLVDVEAYRDFGEFQVREGWIMAPRDLIFVEYNADPDLDPLASRYAIEGIPLPRQRLSVQDVLALLYKANVKTTEEMFRRMHLELEAERKLKDQELEITPLVDQNADFLLVKTRETSEELPVEYALEICPDPLKVPFTWGAVRLNYQQFSRPRFEATLTRQLGGLRKGENLAELPDPDWTPEIQDPVPYEEFAYLTLPTEQGAWCRFEANLAVRMGNQIRNMKLDRAK